MFLLKRRSSGRQGMVQNGASAWSRKSPSVVPPTKGLLRETRSRGTGRMAKGARSKASLEGDVLRSWLEAAGPEEDEEPGAAEGKLLNSTSLQRTTSSEREGTAEESRSGLSEESMGLHEGLAEEESESDVGSDAGCEEWAAAQHLRRAGLAAYFLRVRTFAALVPGSVVIASLDADDRVVDVMEGKELLDNGSLRGFDKLLKINGLHPEVLEEAGRRLVPMVAGDDGLLELEVSRARPYIKRQLRDGALRALSQPRAGGERLEESERLALELLMYLDYVDSKIPSKKAWYTERARVLLGPEPCSERSMRRRFQRFGSNDHKSLLKPDKIDSLMKAVGMGLTAVGTTVWTSVGTETPTGLGSGESPTASLTASSLTGCRPRSANTYYLSSRDSAAASAAASASSYATAATLSTAFTASADALAERMPFLFRPAGGSVLGFAASESVTEELRPSDAYGGEEPSAPPSEESLGLMVDAWGEADVFLGRAKAALVGKVAEGLATKKLTQAYVDESGSLVTRKVQADVDECIQQKVVRDKLREITPKKVSDKAYSSKASKLRPNKTLFYLPTKPSTKTNPAYDRPSTSNQPPSADDESRSR